MTRDPLEQAYRAAAYIVEFPGETVALRVGEASPRLDAILAQLGAGTWAFITAYNPGSHVQTPEVNAERNSELHALLAAEGYRTIDGEGISDDGSWEPERSYFVVGIEHAKAIEIAQRFSQRGVVMGRHGAPPELVMIRVHTSDARGS